MNRTTVCMLSQTPTDFVQEMWPYLLPMSFPSFVIHHSIFSVETTFIRNCSKLLHVPTSSTSPLFSLSGLPFSTHTTGSNCHRVHVVPLKEEPVFLSAGIFPIFFFSLKHWTKKKYNLLTYVFQKNPAQWSEILFLNIIIPVIFTCDKFLTL